MARLFGPIQGAGTQVLEKDAEQPITPASLGWAAWAGILERGPTDELIYCYSKSDAIAKTGNLISESHLPDCIRDFFDLSGGAGGLLLVRITDGNEVAASVPLYARRTTRTQIGTLSAKNGGRWGGFAARATGSVEDADLEETTIDTGVLTWKTDQWKGAYLELAEVPNVRYEVLGNTAAGVITVAADSLMLTDLGVETETRWYLTLEGREDRGLQYVVGDASTDPDNLFYLAIMLDGIEVMRWDDLSMNPEAERYWETIVNEDSANYYVVAEDTWNGARPANIRPANIWGEHTALTATVLTAKVHEFAVESEGGGNPTFALGAVTSDHVAQTITVTMTDATNGTAVSNIFGALGAVVLGSEFEPEVKWAPPFTVTAGGTALEADDVLTIVFKPLAPSNELINGYLVPDKNDNPDKSYRIIANTPTTITVAVGSDMATDVNGGDTEFMVIAPLRFSGGRDGHADVVDNDYVEAFDTDSSLFKRIEGQGLGLVKFAAPGVTNTAVQKAGAAFVSSLAVGPQQWRYEVPSNLTTESAIADHVHNTLGRSAYGDYVVTAQSFGYVNNPEATAQLKLISLTGMIQGREAAIAASYGGYHKAASGLAATLPRLVKLPTGDRRLNEEFLNPRGINVIRKQDGNFILWGDRTVTSNSAWKFKHAREVMSYVMNVLKASFDFTIFEINDPIQWAVVRTSLLSFFKPMYQARALDNSLPFNQACVIKIDAENNTPATQANGDLNVSVTIAIVNTIERLKFSIGKAGINPTGA